MESKLPEQMRKLRNLFICTCKWIWRTRGVFWGTILLNVALSGLATLLFFRWPWSTNPKVAEDGSLIKWMLQYSSTFLLCAIILILLTVITGLVSQLREGLSYEELKQRYLHRVILETELLTLSGIPAGIIADSVPLDDIFIPMQLRPDRPLTDYPLTDEQREQVRRDLNKGNFPEDEQQILIDVERSWYRIKQHDSLNIADLWLVLSSHIPVAVIQGFPGIGKSTLMTRLALHMARLSLNQRDPTMGPPLSPSCIPIFIQLGAYATECEKAHQRSTSLSIADYITLMADEIPFLGLAQWLQECLLSGHCLVLLDGLDEVSKPEIRKQIQDAIITFVRNYGKISNTHFNRFLITSRVVGYDQEAFRAWPHYTLAELTKEQIKLFLPRWCHASAYRNRRLLGHQSHREETIAREAGQMANHLLRAIEKHPGIRELTQNPLLLTLLVVMQQNTIELPRQRVELYAVVTRTLLENRNLAKGLIPIPEAQTIERLGPTAFEMQAVGNSFAPEKKVMDSLRETIVIREGGTSLEASYEAKRFIKRIRERGGIFVLRTEEYFGFS
ncbi:MAG TPA: NACHT domain-containing protein, partial [Ktedonobacteraceae bacterium]